MSKKTTKKPVKKKKTRAGRILSTTIYAYVEAPNQSFAVKQGQLPKFGTTSAYINFLIAKDRGAKAATGTKNQQKV